MPTPPATTVGEENLRDSINNMLTLRRFIKEGMSLDAARPTIDFMLESCIDFSTQAYHELCRLNEIAPHEDLPEV